MRESVLILDHAWPDLDLERTLLDRAGFDLECSRDLGVPPEQLISHASALMTNWDRVPGALIRAGSRLRVITRLGAGVDNIDVPVARERGLVVTYVPDYCVEEVSDHVLALTLNHLRRISELDRHSRSGVWETNTAGLKRLSSQTIGIWGAGLLGTRTAEKFAALGCRVLVHVRTPRHTVGQNVDLDTLLGESDVLSLHIPAQSDGHPLVGEAELSQMKPGSLLVNTSRGSLLDNEALLSALDAGRPGAAALDVVGGEPSPPAVVLEHPQTIVTPHVAFASDESVAELRRRATEDVIRVLTGIDPRNEYRRDLEGEAQR